MDLMSTTVRLFVQATEETTRSHERSVCISTLHFWTLFCMSADGGVLAAQHPHAAAHLFKG